MLSEYETVCKIYANMKNIYLWFSCLLYIVLFVIILPQSRHNFGADAIAYIQEAKLYSTGNFSEALNACWSPFFTWALVPFIKAGIEPLLACRLVNGLAGLLCIPLFYKLTGRFVSLSIYRNILVVFSAVLFISFTFHRLGADTVQLLILLAYLTLIFHDFFLKRRSLIIVAGIAGACAYYAKAYNFYFFILHIIFTFFILSGNLSFKSFFAQRRKLLLAISAFLICVIPYIVLISLKYNKVTVSTAGPITMNKVLQADFTDGPKFFVPPHGINALSIADDPTFFQKKYTTPFTSSYYLLKEIKNSIANVFEYARLLNEISFFSITIIAVFLFLILVDFKKRRDLKKILLLATVMLYPVGYLLIAVEWRYIWLVPLLLLIMGGIIWEKISLAYMISSLAKKILACAIILSFSILPISEIKDIYKSNDLEEMALALRQNGITGNFIGTSNNWANTKRNYVIAYLNNSKYFGLYNDNFTADIILKGSKQYGVKYFLIYYSSETEKKEIIVSETAQRSLHVFPDIYPGVVVCQLL